MNETQLTFTLENFEGPLDLLLHLIRDNKVDILEIRISRLLEQYLNFLEKAREADLDIASEFIEMASRLIRIKTNMMLPKYNEEDADSLRGLTADLIEYSLCKELAQKLRENNSGFGRHCRDALKLDFDNTYALNHDISELMNAYFSATKRGKRREKPSSKAFEGIVSHRIVSVTSRALFLLKNLLKTGKINLKQIYRESDDRSELVATFLAVLELVKTKRIYLNDDNDEVILTKARYSEK